MAVNLSARYENFSVGDAALMSALDGLATFSISLWARYAGGDRDSDFCTWGPHSATTGGWLFWRDEADTKFGRANTFSCLVDNDKRCVAPSETWDNTLWHHVCMTMQANSATGLGLYLDGVRTVYNQNSLVGWAGFVDPGVVVRFGDSVPNAGSSWMVGDLDDCRLYNRVLLPNEIIALFTRRGMDDIFDGMLLRYTLQEKAPGVAMDGTSNEVKDSGPEKYDGSANDTGYPTYIESAILNGTRRRSA